MLNGEEAPFFLFLTPQIRPINQTQFPAIWIGGYLKKNHRSDFFEGYYCTIIVYDLALVLGCLGRGLNCMCSGPLLVVVPGYGTNYAHQESRTQVWWCPRSPSDALSDSPTRPPSWKLWSVHKNKWKFPTFCLPYGNLHGGSSVMGKFRLNFS